MIVPNYGAQTLDLRTVDLPYMVQLFGVTDEMFDELTDEDTKAELLDGVMIVHSPASMRHDMVGNFLRALMGSYAEEKDLGAIYGPDCITRLAKGRRFAPDLFFLAASRIPQPTPQEYYGVPDLIVEVLSPSNRDYDLGEKRSTYREAGVPEIWLVDPREEQILIDRKRRKTYASETVATGRATSSVLDGFWVDPAWLWADPAPKVLRCIRAILKG
jgi:Uma2 family endonuclease